MTSELRLSALHGCHSHLVMLTMERVGRRACARFAQRASGSCERVCSC